MRCSRVYVEDLNETSLNEKGVNINGEKLNRLRFVKDVVISEIADEVESMLTELYTESKKDGLKMHMGNGYQPQKDIGTQVGLHNMPVLDKLDLGLC